MLVTATKSNILLPLRDCMKLTVAFGQLPSSSRSQKPGKSRSSTISYSVCSVFSSRHLLETCSIRGRRGGAACEMRCAVASPLCDRLCPLSDCAIDALSRSRHSLSDSWYSSLSGVAMLQLSRGSAAEIAMAGKSARSPHQGNHEIPNHCCIHGNMRRMRCEDDESRPREPSMAQRARPGCRHDAKASVLYEVCHAAALQ